MHYSTGKDMSLMDRADNHIDQNLDKEVMQRALKGSNNWVCQLREHTELLV